MRAPDHFVLRGSQRSLAGETLPPLAQMRPFCLFHRGQTKCETERTFRTHGARSARRPKRESHEASQFNKEATRTKKCRGTLAWATGVAAAA